MRAASRQVLLCDHPDAQREAATLSGSASVAISVLCGACGEAVLVTLEDEMLWVHDSAGSAILTRERAHDQQGVVHSPGDVAIPVHTRAPLNTELSQGAYG